MGNPADKTPELCANRLWMGVGASSHPPAQQQGRKQRTSLCDTSGLSPAAPVMLNVGKDPAGISLGILLCSIPVLFSRGLQA